MKNTVEYKKSIFQMKNEVYSWVVGLKTQITKALATREPFLSDHKLWNAQCERAKQMKELVKTWKSECELSLNNYKPFTRQFFVNMVDHMEEWINDMNSIESKNRIRSIFSNPFRPIADQELSSVSALLLTYGSLFALEEDVAESSNSASLPSSSSNDGGSSSGLSLNLVSSNDEQDVIIEEEVPESSMGSPSQSSSSEDIHASAIHLQNFLQTRDFASLQLFLEDGSLTREQIVELADWCVDEVRFNPLHAIDVAMQSDNVEAINALINHYDNKSFNVVKVKILELKDRIQTLQDNNKLLTKCIHFIVASHGDNKSKINEIRNVLKNAENSLMQLFPDMKWFVDKPVIENNNVSINAMFDKYREFVKEVQKRLEHYLVEHKLQTNKYQDYISMYKQFHFELKKNRIDAINAQCLVDISQFGLNSQSLNHAIAERIFHRTLHLHALFEDGQEESFLMKAIALGKTNVAIKLLQNLMVTDWTGQQIRSGMPFDKISSDAKFRLSAKLIEMLNLRNIFDVVDQNGNTLIQQIMINNSSNSKECNYVYQCIFADVINPQYKNHDGKTITTVKNRRGETLLHLASRELLGYQNYCQYANKQPDNKIINDHFEIIQFCINQGANILQADNQGIVSWSNLFELLSTSIGSKVRDLLQNDFKTKMNGCKNFYQHESNGVLQPWSSFQRSVLKLLVNKWCQSPDMLDAPSSSNANIGELVSNRNSNIESMIKEVIDAYRFKQPDRILSNKINQQLERLENKAMPTQQHSSRYGYWMPVRHHDDKDKKSEKMISSHRAIDFVAKK